MPKNRKPYPSDVSDEEWSFGAPYLALAREDAPQRRHDLREVFDALRWIVRAGAPWRMMPNDFPPWDAVYQQTQRWIAAEVFGTLVHDLRVMLRLAQGRTSDPSDAVLDSRTLRSTPESGHRGGYDGAKRKKGSKVHAAVDTLGHLLALRGTPATEQDRAQVGALAEAVQEATGESVELAYVDRGYTGEEASAAAEAHGIRLEVVKQEEDGGAGVPEGVRPCIGQTGVFGDRRATVCGRGCGCRRRNPLGREDRPLPVLLEGMIKRNSHPERLPFACHASSMQHVGK